MTKEDIIRMAREAGLGDTGVREGFIFFQPGTDGLERFAVLVAAAARAEENEACVKVVEDYCGAWDDEGYALAAAIRARGQP